MGRHAAPDIDASLRYAAELDRLFAEDPAAAAAAAAATRRGEPWTASRRQLREARQARRSTFRRGRYLALLLVLPLMAAALAGVFATWPGDARAALRQAHAEALAAGDVTEVTATVLAVRTAACPSRPDGSTGGSTGGSAGSAGGAECVVASVRIDDDAATASFAQVALGPAGRDPGVVTGDELRLLRTDGTTGPRYAVTDVVRGTPVALLGLGFVALLLLAARWRGVGALVGLVLGYAVIGAYVLPALLAGEMPVLVGLSAAALMLAPLLYLTQGISMRSTTALAGGLLGLCVMAGFGVLGALLARLTGLEGAGPEVAGSGAATGLGGVDVALLVPCGLLLAAVGLLADVAATQCRAVWDLHDLAPGMAPLELFVHGLRSGRVHLATSVPTVAFAAAGTLLPALLLLAVTQPSLAAALSGDGLAREAVRLAAAAAGVLVAVPLTTALAAFVAAGPRPP